MYDFSVPNSKPGDCEKCRGSGVYRWGPVTNGKVKHEGTCYSCKGTGKQDRAQIKRNVAYNVHKLRSIGI